MRRSSSALLRKGALELAAVSHGLEAPRLAATHTRRHPLSPFRMSGYDFLVPIRIRSEDKLQELGRVVPRRRKHYRMTDRMRVLRGD